MGSHVYCSSRAESDSLSFPLEPGHSHRGAEDGSAECGGLPFPHHAKLRTDRWTRSRNGSRLAQIGKQAETEAKLAVGNL